ncbi:putative mitochondrion protein [Dioszegia hungarica]|uniref:Mitochondrion protein n=1 Tax=Dioszegia hungarica TaxID=4972 RepID=A0AA38LXT9_9TREE|nr:putative mitochondrion protein [Dioszegia hungarica]KAI9637756.1 putative mitochondrion protein [Dioszegia hungarica]
MPISRLIRFIPRALSSTSSSSSALPSLARAAPLIGEPVDPELDVGLATYSNQDVEVDVYSGTSVLAPGSKTGKREMVGRLLSPLAREEVGTIRCIGLNYHRHASEMDMSPPPLPTLFLKPSTALGDPYPAPTILPKAFEQDNAADYEAELVVVIGKDCKNVGEEEAMDYVLGYTAANDVSSRLAQFAQSQWCFSKGFDGACPLGPALVMRDQVELGKMEIRAELNGETVQESGINDLIFGVPKIVSFLSQGTTLPAGTIILTGTPAGVGWSSKPRKTLQDGDEYRVWVSGGVGTLINKIEQEV